MLLGDAQVSLVVPGRFEIVLVTGGLALLSTRRRGWVQASGVLTWRGDQPANSEGEQQDRAETASKGGYQRARQIDDADRLNIARRRQKVDGNLPAQNGSSDSDGERYA